MQGKQPRGRIHDAETKLLLWFFMCLLLFFHYSNFYITKFHQRKMYGKHDWENAFITLREYYFVVFGMRRYYGLYQLTTKIIESLADDWSSSLVIPWSSLKWQVARGKNSLLWEPLSPVFCQNLEVRERQEGLWPQHLLLG